LNIPAGYNIVANNTVMGTIGSWGRWPGDPIDSMFGVRLINNLLGGFECIDTTGKMAHIPHYDLILSENLQNIPENKLNRDNFTSDSRPGIDSGITLPGITDGFSGNSPDLGAYESGLLLWKAGHDFENPPEPSFELTSTPLANQIVNACFEYTRYGKSSTGNELAPWEKIGVGTAKYVLDDGFVEHPNTRNSINGGTLMLSGPVDDGIMQMVGNLIPDTDYIFTAWVKTPESAEIGIGVSDYGGVEIYSSSTEKKWTHLEVRFKTGKSGKSAKVFIIKKDTGIAYTDNIGLVPDFNGK
jgi:hypothetical protein